MSDSEGSKDLVSADPGQSGHRLLLVRHSAVVIDAPTPSHQWRLSADGRQRCRFLADWLATRLPSVIVTSTEPKAQETGQIIADHLGLPWETSVGLHEQDRRDAPHIDTAEAFQAAVVSALLRPDDLVFGRETAAKALERFDAAMKRVLDLHREGEVVIVAHGTVIALFIGRYNPGMDVVAFWRELTLPCAFSLSLPEMRLLEEWKYRPRS